MKKLLVFIHMYLVSMLSLVRMGFLVVLGEALYVLDGLLENNTILSESLIFMGRSLKHGD